jgi:hypothetical protein
LCLAVVSDTILCVHVCIVRPQMVAILASCRGLSRVCVWSGRDSSREVVMRGWRHDVCPVAGFMRSAQLLFLYSVLLSWWHAWFLCWCYLRRCVK